MDEKTLKTLMDWAAGAPIAEVDITIGESRIHLVKAAGAAASVPVPAPPPVPAASAQTVIAAPMPGVFYLQSAPDAPPFVAVGQHVRAGDTVGIVEAMKMFNHVTSEVDGIVEAVLAEPEDEVAAGQPLVALRPGGGA